MQTNNQQLSDKELEEYDSYDEAEVVEDDDMEDETVVATPVVTATIAVPANITLDAPAFSTGPYFEHMINLFPFTGQQVIATSLDCFSGTKGKAYHQYINTHTTWLNDFINHNLPNSAARAWLVPYTGNAHNRAMFTQLVLHVLGKRKHQLNRTHLPNLFEPFVGSGQIFLGADAFADFLTEPAPFGNIIGGDLNRFLIAAYHAMQQHDDFVQQYEAFCKTYDPKLATDSDVYTVRVHEINTLPKTDILNIGLRYVWLINRCVRGTTVSSAGKFNGKPNKTLRAKEPSLEILGRVQRMVRDNTRGGQRLFVTCDFAVTSAPATAQDIVFLDCPFPQFSSTIPTTGGLTSVPSGVYGLDNEGGLQQRILTEATRLANQGTTVLLCNFANPDLVRAYSKLLTDTGVQNPKDYIFTYRPLKNGSSVYQLCVVPGAGVDMSDAMVVIRALAKAFSNNMNFL